MGGGFARETVDPSVKEREMSASSRRAFFDEVGGGMMAAALGPSLAAELGLAVVRADEAERGAGRLAPLCDLLQGTPADALMPILVEKIRAGTTLRELAAAGALANARGCGGDDYVGFHTFMAIGPALAMSAERSGKNAALPVLKVLHRNARRLQELGGAKASGLKPSAPRADSPPQSDEIRVAVRSSDRNRAEGLLDAAVAESPAAGYDALLYEATDAADVHRVVLAQRSWDMIDIVGREHALAMLRQSLNYCLKHEERSAKHEADLRTVAPKLFDRHRLATLETGARDPGEKWFDDFSKLLFTANPGQAAEAAALALVEGVAPKFIFEAAALAANEMVLREPGRRGREISAGKPEGSVHGDSIGVHASDSANAWREIARVAKTRHRHAAVLLAAYQVARDRTERGGDLEKRDAHPSAERLEEARKLDAAQWIGALEEAIRGRDQARAAAVAYVAADGQGEAAFDVLRRHAVTADGALHSEKYYRTVRIECAAARPGRRNRYLAALARVTASAFGFEAPGVKAAAKLLG
jgi:hypothetical protein